MKTKIQIKSIWGSLLMEYMDLLREKKRKNIKTELGL